MDESGRSIARRLIEHAPVLLLVVVAIAQIALARSQGLLAWKGGGFGMFATVDGVELREVRARARDGATIEIPTGVFREERRARIHPSAHNLDALARAIEAESGEAGGAAAGFEVVEVDVVEVWRTRIDGDPLLPTRERLAVVESLAR